MSSTVSITNDQLDKFSAQYKKRRKLQMFKFFGATIFTLVSARLAFRGISARKYIPTMFQLNHKPPTFSYKGEVFNALAYGTGLSTGGFAMLAFGFCWIWDVSTLAELAAKLKGIMGESSKPNISNMDLDEDTRKVAEALEEIIASKK